MKKIGKDPLMVLCVARIEGIKNQLNLIKALNNTEYQLLHGRRCRVVNIPITGNAGGLPALT